MAVTLKESVFLQGSNQFKSQYRIDFPGGFPTGVTTPSDPNLLILRLDKEFEIPKQTDYKYKRYYNGMGVEETGPKDETEYVIKLDFRKDVNWEVWNVFQSWKQFSFNNKEGSVGDEATVRRDIRFQALGTVPTPGIPKPVVKTFTFRYAKPFSSDPGTYSHEEGDPARAVFELMFVMIDES